MWSAAPTCSDVPTCSVCIWFLQLRFLQCVCRMALQCVSENHTLQGCPTTGANETELGEPKCQIHERNYFAKYARIRCRIQIIPFVGDALRHFLKLVANAENPASGIGTETFGWTLLRIVIWPCQCNGIYFEKYTTDIRSGLGTVPDCQTERSVHSFALQIPMTRSDRISSMPSLRDARCQMAKLRANRADTNAACVTSGTGPNGTQTIVATNRATAKNATFGTTTN